MKNAIGKLSSLMRRGKQFKKGGIKSPIATLLFAALVAGGGLAYQAVANIDGVDIVSPTNTSTTYVQSGNQVGVSFNITTSVAGVGKLKVEIYSGSVEIGSTGYYDYTFVSGANDDLFANVLINASAIEGDYNVKVSAQQPSVSGGWLSGIEMGAVVVDNTAPAVSSIVSSDTDISESDTGADKTLTVTVTFDETMDTNIIPVIVFNADITSGTLTFNSGVWSAEGTVYTATYNIADVDKEQIDVDIIVSGAKDLAGNEMVETTEVNVIDVDTIAPTAAATVSPSTGTAKVGTEITATLTSSNSDLTAGACTINGIDSSLTNNTDGTYTLTYIVANGNADWALGTLPISCVLSESSGNSVTIDVFSDSNTLAGDANIPDVPSITSIAGDDFLINNSEASAIIVTGTAEAGSTVNISLSDTSSAVVTVTGSGIATDGSYSITIDGTSLAEGTITPSVTATDAALNVSSPAVQPTATKDTGIPNAPIITSIAGDDFLINNSEVSAVIVTGTAEAGSTVDVSLTGGVAVFGSDTATDGSYSITIVGTSLTDGIITPLVTATDAAGNVSPAKTEPTAIKDVVAPTATVAVLPLIADNNLTQTVIVTYNEPMNPVNPVITITDLYTDPYTVTSGSWNTENTVYTVMQAINNDNEEAIATVNVGGAVDLAGNSQIENNSTTFTVDTKNPTVEVTSTTADGNYKVGDTINITLTFSENIISSDNITVTLNTNRICTISKINTVTNIAACDYVVQTGDTSSDLAVNSITGTVVDTAGNAANLIPTSNISDTSNIIIDTTAPAGFTVGAVTTTGGTEVAGKWNSTNTSINVKVPIADDNSLEGGTIQLQAKVTDGTFASLGSSVSISSVNTNQTVSVSDTDFESIANFANYKTVTLTAIITDTAGNPTTGAESATTIYIDQTVPVITVDNLITNDTTPALTGTISDSSATIKVTVNGATYDATNNGSTWTLADNTITTALVDGTYDVAVAATDLAGNIGSDTTSNELVIDIIAPTISNILPADSSYIDNNKPTISVTLGDDNSGINTSSVTISVNGSNVTTLAIINQTSVSYTPETALPEGIILVVINVSDNAGNPATQSSTAFTVDTINPKVTIDLVTTPTNQNTQTITGTFTEANIFTISVNGVNATISGSTYTAENVPLSVEGSNTIIVTATDLAGNTGTDTTNIDLDTGKPTVISIIPTTLADADTIGSVSVAITFSEAMGSTDPTVTITGLKETSYGVTAIADPWSDNNTKWTGTFTLTDDNEDATGIYNISIATDAVGNVMVADSSKTVAVDTENPTAIVEVGTAIISDGDLVQEVTVDYNEEISATPAPTITFSGGTWTAGAGYWNTATKWIQPFTITNNEEEIVNVDVTVSGATDLVGNIQGSKTTEDLFDIDTQNPAAPDSTKMTVAMNAPLTVDTISGVAGAVEGSATVKAYSNVGLTDLIGFMVAAGDGSFSAINIGDNNHAIVYVTATDAAGNESGSTAMVNDIAAPDAPTDLVLTDPVNDGNKTTVTITGTGEVDAVINWTIIDKDSTSITGTGAVDSSNISITNIDVSTLADGTLTLTLTLTDSVGNVSEAGTDTATKDVLAPSVEITYPLAGIKVNGDVAIIFTGDDLTNSQCSINSGNWVNCESGVTKLYDIIEFGDLDEDEIFTFYLKDTDTAGNTGTDSEENIIKDSLAPTITNITSDKANGSYTVGEEIDIDITFSENVISTGDITVTLDTSGTCVIPEITTAVNTATCNYTVAVGENTADLDATVSGTIVDEAGNAMTSFTPALAENKDIIIDTIAPTLAEINPVLTPSNNNTPSYTFNSDEDGAITYAGECGDGDIVNAINGGNTVVFNALADGIYGNCAITVTDEAGNSSEALAITEFIVDTTVPVITNLIPTGDGTPVLDVRPVISATFNELGSGIIDDIEDKINVEIKNQAGEIVFPTSYFTVNNSGIYYKPVVDLEKSKMYTVIIKNVEDKVGNIADTVQWHFTISDSATSEDTTPPTATQDPKDGDINVLTTVNPTITFSEAMNETTLVSGNIELRKFSDDSEVGATLNVNEDGTKVEFNLNSELEYNTKYYFYIDAGVKDLAGNSLNPTWTKTKQNDHEFTIIAEDVPVTSYDIPLNAGWNLISFPVIPENSNIDIVLNSISDYVDIVWYYEAGKWYSYPGTATENTLSAMEDGKGYWVYMNSSSDTYTLTINGTETFEGGTNFPGYTLVENDWNLIGFKSTTEMIANDYIRDFTDHRLNESSILWDYKDGSYPLYPLHRDDIMKPGYGYWLRVK